MPSYQAAGVDVEKGEAVAKALEPLLQATWNDRITPNISGFKAVCDLGDAYLVGATDGVGTKLLVALAAGKPEAIGQDLVAMCVNDLVRVGAKPLFFLDYLATGKLKAEQHRRIMQSISEACQKVPVPFIGGETAEMPGLYQGEHLDLAGFAVGCVKKEELIDGKSIQPGATLLGLASSGAHSNGYSLLRHIFFENLGLTKDHLVSGYGRLEDLLLIPTALYVQPVLGLLQTFPQQVQGFAHITGGGIPNKLPKCFPAGLGAVVDEKQWPLPAIFQAVQERGKVSQEEMRNTFNMGIGMIAVVNDGQKVPEMQEYLGVMHGLRSYVMGSVVEGEGVRYV